MNIKWWMGVKLFNDMVLPSRDATFYSRPTHSCEIYISSRDFIRIFGCRVPTRRMELEGG